MGGDQQDELLKTIMEKYSSLITVVIILVSIALIMILFGVIKTIIDASKAKKLALAGAPTEAVPVEEVKVEEPAAKVEAKPVAKAAPKTKKAEVKKHG